MEGVVDNINAKYPIINYKSITYFPMTWNYCQSLGLSTKWDDTLGFYISLDTNIGKADLVQEIGEENTQKSYSAMLPNYQITVNSKIIDNSNEEYPVIVFRNITYFPMTWNSSVNEFNLTTSWDESSGFSIKRKE